MAAHFGNVGTYGVKIELKGDLVTLLSLGLGPKTAKAAPAKSPHSLRKRAFC
ncbi:hypothetical protein [Azospirillum endophyticum]